MPIGSPCSRKGRSWSWDRMTSSWRWGAAIEPCSNCRRGGSSPKPTRKGWRMSASPDRLPPAFVSMWRVLRLGFRHEPRLMIVAFVLWQLAALPDALLAVWLKLLGDGVLQGRARLVGVAATGLGLSATATWFLGTVSTRVSRRFRDKVTIALEAHVARLQASIATIAHQERPEFLDRLSVLRNQIF